MFFFVFVRQLHLQFEMTGNPFFYGERQGCVLGDLSREEVAFGPKGKGVEETNGQGYMIGPQGQFQGK